MVFEIIDDKLVMTAIVPVMNKQEEHFGSLEFIQGIDSIAKQQNATNGALLLLMPTKLALFDIEEETPLFDKNYIISQEFIDQNFTKELNLSIFRRLYHLLM